MKGPEKIVPGTPVFVIARALPIGVVVIPAMEKPLRMRHQAEDAAAFILETGDAFETAVDLVEVSAAAPFST